MFMGDAGSIPLGFLAAALGISGWRDGTWQAWFPLVVFAPFVIDASVTLARRALRHEKLWLPHREHYYQRLVRMGWGHRRTALAEYAFMLLCAGAALAVCRQPPGLQYVALVAVALVCGLLMWRVDRAWNRHSAC
jgi:UDP-N-acetylmuramyl pentapeptide phosphotransferase/UDP-N-acetylglucosamine-1-phosphate transferase